MQRSTHNISSSIMSRMAVFETPITRCDFGDDLETQAAAQTQAQRQTYSFAETTNEHGRTTTSSPSSRMMMSSSPTPPSPPVASGVQTDAEGLILPKKLINPCLESTDRKELHRELKFNNRIGKSVLNQKSELQRAYEKQKERHVQAQEQHSPSAEALVGGLSGELGRVIMERAQKLESAAAAHGKHGDSELDDERKYVNPDYLNVRAKLRTAHAPN